MGHDVGLQAYSRGTDARRGAPTLDAWAREQDQTPWYRFTTAQAGSSDPFNQTEAVGDADALRATALGLKNLERVAAMLLTATMTKTGDPYRELTEVYGRLLAQWTLEMNHVPPLIGGFLSQQRHIGQEGVRFTPVPKARQAAATQFLLANAFVAPGVSDQAGAAAPYGARRCDEPLACRADLGDELDAAERSDRTIGRAGRARRRRGLTAEQFLGDVRSGIWSELTTPRRPIDPFRRNTQRAYLDTIDNRLNGGVPPDAEVRALLRGELRALRAQLVAAIPLVTDRASRLHLEDSRDQIDEGLDPRAMRQRPAAGRGGAPGVGCDLRSPSRWRFDFDNDPFQAAPDRCWPDYVL